MLPVSPCKLHLEILKREKRMSSIVAITQTVDELAIGAVLNGSLCNTVLICIGKNRLIVPNVLCYAFHEKASFVCGLSA